MTDQNHADDDPFDTQKASIHSTINPENWVDEYGDAMYRYALSKLGDAAIAEELVQETFLAGLRALDGFQQKSKVSTWLFAILRRKVVDHYRSRRATTFDPQNPGCSDTLIGDRSAESSQEFTGISPAARASSNGNSICDQLSTHQHSSQDSRIPAGHSRSWSADPADIFENHEFWKTFQSCVDKLPDKLAEVHLLREINQHTPKEICKILGITPTNLSMRLHRCRLALRDCLERNWFQENK